MDEILEETKKKLLAIAKNSLAEEVKQLKEKIEYLESENKALKDRERDIAIKVQEWEYKEKNMRKVVEDEFYKKTLEDILTEKAEQVDLWYAAWWVILVLSVIFVMIKRTYIWVAGW